MVAIPAKHLRYTSSLLVLKAGHRVQAFFMIEPSLSLTSIIYHLSSIYTLRSSPSSLLMYTSFILMISIL